MTAEIECVVRQIRDKAIAIADGTTHDYQDPRTGELTERERWYWIPKSLIKAVEPEDYEVGTRVMLTIPTRLAQKKELV